jgi:hypothetical protein
MLAPPLGACAWSDLAGLREETASLTLAPGYGAGSSPSWTGLGALPAGGMFAGVCSPLAALAAGAAGALEAPGSEAPGARVASTGLGIGTAGA